jgi:transposase InsO family protein
VEGEAGLYSKSRRPHRISGRKVSDQIEAWILDFRSTQNIGPKSIQDELLRLQGVRLSTATIWKVLDRNEVKPLKRPPRPPKPNRYNKEVPGQRVQMDTTKIAPGFFQFTAIDDCTRIRVLGLYPRRTAGNAVKFLEERMLEEFPFPIQRIQTDRGGEFFGLAFQRALKRHHIKFRPVRPYAPHLNGKVERSQRTDKKAFWALADLDDPQIDMRLQEWQFFYNAQRSHGGIDGVTPMQKYAECASRTPWSWEVWNDYDPEEEPERIRNYAADQTLMRLKRSV